MNKRLYRGAWYLRLASCALCYVNCRVYLVPYTLASCNFVLCTLYGIPYTLHNLRRTSGGVEARYWPTISQYSGLYA